MKVRMTIFSVLSGALMLVLAGVAETGEIFASKCAMCHGKDGKGGKMCEKDITGLDEAAIKKALSGSDKPKMHKKDLTADEIKGVIACLKGKGGADGAGVFAKKCAMCHGEDGKGGKMCEKDITALEAAAIVKAISGDERPKMHKTAMCEDMSKGVAAYLTGGEAPSCDMAGGKLFAGKCAMCHGEDGKGGKMVKKDITSLDAAAIVKALTGDDKPKMHKKPVTEAEAKDIAAYVAKSLK